MKRIGLLLALTALAAAAVSAQASTAAKRAICHHTSSAKNPYVKLSVSASRLKTLLKQPADIYPVPASGCPKTLLTARAGGRGFDVSLVGETESPAGDPVATGTATFRLRTGQGQVCYTLAAKNLPTAVGAHIHAGAAGTAGPVVIPLATPDSTGNASGCATASRAVVASILQQPGAFYANVHTAEFPGGAIRGQLTGTSSAAFGWVAAVDLKGTSEPAATGTAVVRIRKDAGLVCYRLHAANITLPATGAHIHRGAAGANGPVVVPFTPPDANGDSEGCVTASPASLIDEIIATPAGFYVNVHTKEHPAGAIRAQLG